MKIAYVDIDLSGHHKKYLLSLAENYPNSILIVPEHISEISVERQFVVKNTSELHKYPTRYLRWLSNVYSILKKEHVDCVHFLYGDAFARYFGIGLNKFRRFRLVMTFHQIRRNTLKDISLKCIFKKIDFGIVHTEKLFAELKKFGFSNIVQIEYPSFVKLGNATLSDRSEWGVPGATPILLLIGVLSRYKGLDMLVTALKQVNQDYCLVVAGKNVDFSSEEIYQFQNALGNKVKMFLRHITDNEYESLINLCDYVVLPYSRNFDGASGPLVDAVLYRHPVIASDYGSLGCIVKTNHLGYIYECENCHSLTNVLEYALNNRYEWTKEAEKYRDTIQVQTFIESNMELYNSFL